MFKQNTSTSEDSDSRSDDGSDFEYEERAELRRRYESDVQQHNAAASTAATQAASSSSNTTSMMCSPNPMIGAVSPPSQPGIFDSDAYRKTAAQFQEECKQQ